MSAPARDHRHPVAILGATGIVGQTLVWALEGHPWFRVDELRASPQSAGLPYAEAVRWVLPEPPPPAALGLVVGDVAAPVRSRVVFSAVPATVARSLEPALARAGHRVYSNASAHRLDPQVPLLIPDVNPEAARTLVADSSVGDAGVLVTNPNCVVAGLCVALAPLVRSFGLRSLSVTTLQARSGAGAHGLTEPSWNANVIPGIAGEADKIRAETQRILGVDAPISVATHRVDVAFGHLASLGITFESSATLDEVQNALRARRLHRGVGQLPSRPDPLLLLEGGDGPQPARDCRFQDGMTVRVGQLVPDPLFDYRMTVLVHNLCRGAAGAAILNAEYVESMAGRVTRPPAPPSRAGA